MTDSTHQTSTDALSHEEMQSALFAQLVIQQANMAYLLLGKTPHPETGKTVRDLDAARQFIDQLEMLETKTKGNLTGAEQNLLKQSLMSLRMAFVETANEPPAPTPAEAKTDESKMAGPEERESKVKFSKKF